MAHRARTTSHAAAAQDWIMDSNATHHIINAFDNLHLNRPYHGTNELLVGDGTGLPITHTGKTSICISSRCLQLPNVLHVPKISKKLLSISSLCENNHISIVFFWLFFGEGIEDKVPSNQRST